MPTIAEKNLTDARFRILMAYRVVDVFEMMNGGAIRRPSSSGPVVDNYKAVRVIVSIAFYRLAKYDILCIT